MDFSEFAQLLAEAEQLSPERHPAQAIELNQRIVQLDPHNAAASLRLARGYQAQRNFVAAAAACQNALHHHPQSLAAQRRLQRIKEEWALSEQAGVIATYDEALRRGRASIEQGLFGRAIAYLWRAVALSASSSQSFRAHNALGAAYRSREDLASLDRAADQYEWVLRQSPDNRTARKGLAAVLRDQWELRQTQRGQTWQRHEVKVRPEQGHQQGQRKHRPTRKKAAPRKPVHQIVRKPTTLAEALRILKLRPPATATEIKRAYRTLAQVAHPDHGGSHAAMVRVNAAYKLALSKVSAGS
ncbi:MAG TPA: DnaJ domain-containing protein [Ktedonobacterales bacterium]|jgi:tetratricopeptide (TPR) repeat protein